MVHKAVFIEGVLCYVKDYQSFPPSPSLGEF